MSTFPTATALGVCSILGGSGEEGLLSVAGGAGQEWAAV